MGRFCLTNSSETVDEGGWGTKIPETMLTYFMEAPLDRNEPARRYLLTAAEQASAPILTTPIKKFYKQRRRRDGRLANAIYLPYHHCAYFCTRGCVITTSWFSLAGNHFINFRVGLLFHGSSFAL